MRALPVLALLLVTLGLPRAVLAQGQAEATAVKAAQIADARKANATLMRQYTWHSRTVK